MSFNVTFALRIPLFASPPFALMSSFPPFSILTVSAALFPALRPLPAVVVLISKVAPSILRCPEAVSYTHLSAIKIEWLATVSKHKLSEIKNSRFTADDNVI